MVDQQVGQMQEFIKTQRGKILAAQKGQGFEWASSGEIPLFRPAEAFEGCFDSETIGVGPSGAGFWQRNAANTAFFHILRKFDLAMEVIKKIFPNIDFRRVVEWPVIQPEMRCDRW